MSIPTFDDVDIYRTGRWPFRWGWAAVLRSADYRTVRYGTTLTEKGARRAALAVTKERRAVEGLLYPEANG